MKKGKAFLDALDRKAKLFAGSARANCEANDELCSWILDPLAQWAEAAYGESVFDEAASGYATYSLGVARAQQMYEKSGNFNPETMPEIVTNVYQEESYMVPYMWGAILLYTFWPALIGHVAMFRNEFLRKLPANASVLEMASGHGVLGLLAAEERPDIRIEGVDISPSAVAISKRLLGVSGHASRVSFVVRDAIQDDGSSKGSSYQGIMAPMLAEHLITPRPLFKALSRHLSSDGLVYFSTAIESAQRDHVYEYHHESEPLLMAEEVGLRATRVLSDGIPVPSGTRFLPRAIATILQKR
jgi:2-polyprenyl-3-methyl-5-hydroxy-6-metoxy-1,4-benzoquinol methylase